MRQVIDGLTILGHPGGGHWAIKGYLVSITIFLWLFITNLFTQFQFL